jgi:amidase
MRRSMMWILAVMVSCLVGRAQQSRPGVPVGRFNVVEATIPDMQEALRRVRITSRELVTQYLLRIAMYEGALNATITVNPHALEEAAALDRERSQGKVRGPLHGIPIALKDNIHTTNMPTTGGTVVFGDFVPPYEATLTRNLRNAGAIILAKTSMTELANWMASGMPNNYSAQGRYGRNPYDPRLDPREGRFDGRPALDPGGSSSGIGTAANLWAANVGTETSGSILGPANQNMLTAIKPTVGRISRYGVIPITTDQDTPGPMAKTVADAAILLGAMEGATADPNDPTTKRCAPPPGRTYLRHLRRDGLKGARIGIPRAFFYDGVMMPGRSAPLGGLTAEQKLVMEEAIAVLRKEGAVIVDPADIPSILSTDPERNVLLWNLCAGEGGAKGRDENCSTVFKYGMKRDFNAWLATLGPAAPVKSLGELRAFNLKHRAAGTLKYGQAQLDISDEMDVEKDRARYTADLAKGIELAGPQGIDAAIKQHRLDALLFPAASGYSIAATPGYPTVIVPYAMVANTPRMPFPEGFNARPEPFGVSFTGTACSEARLIELGYAFEQATKRRQPPPLFP